MKTSIFSNVGKIVLLTALTTTSLIFTSCSQGEDPVTPPIIPEVVVTYGIDGVVTDIKNKPLPGVTVNLSGTAETIVSTDADGVFAFTKLAKKGAYTLSLNKEAYNNIIKKINLKNDLISVAIVLPFTPVEVEVAAGKDNNVILDESKTNLTDLSVELAITEGALKADETISVTQSTDPIDAEPISFIVLHYQPDGLVFEKPCIISIPNTLGEYTISTPQLQYLNTKTNKWEVQKQAVTFANNKYNTEINHFSCYKIDGHSTIRATVASTKDISFESIDNLNGYKAVEVKDLPYVSQRGTVYVISPAEAAKKAGINNKNVIQMMEVAIAANTALTKVKEVYGANTTLPVGVRMDIVGKQSFSTVEHEFRFVKEGKEVKATIAVKTAGAVTITPSLYTKEHTGGAGN